ncbi:hypothetical protein AJ87_48985 [Rhizobium yanglingense]|nr:hypothetical protein AJ87_48985 [Rhizobium yanglingense]
MKALNVSPLVRHTRKLLSDVEETIGGQAELLSSQLHPVSETLFRPTPKETFHFWRSRALDAYIAIRLFAK